MTGTGSPTTGRLSRAAPALSAAAAGALCLAGYLLHRGDVVEIPGLAKLEHITVDARYRLRGALEPHPAIVIVGIDDETYERTPEVFLRRRGWARLIDEVSEHEPRAVAIDAYFRARELNLSPELVERGRASIDALSRAEQLGAEARTALEVLRDIDAETRGDEQLIDAISRAGNIVAAVMLFLDGDPAPPGGREPTVLAKAGLDEGVVVAAPAGRRPPRASAVTGSYPAIAEAAASAGFANVTPDDDGIVRRVPLTIEHGGRLYAALGLRMAQLLEDARTGYVIGETGLHFGSDLLPVDGRGRAHLGFLGGDSQFATISAADVIEGKVATDALAGKLVFIGFTDTARDKVTTPLADAVDGVELHATLADNALQGRLLSEAPWWLTALMLVVITTLIALSQLRRIRQRRPWLAGVVALGLIAALLVGAQLAFSHSLVITEVAAPLVTALLATLASVTVSLVSLGREKAQLRSAFSQYVQGSLVERILAEPERVKLGGERRDLTVVFSDIRGFSNFSEDLSPEQLSELLNEYLTPMTEEVFRQGGMLDKYIGDAVMAVYGAPLPMDQTVQAEAACATALAWIASLERLNEGWQKRDLPEVRIGVGINTGPMAVGNMGSETRFDYTVLGDSVNLGARLEAITKDYGVDIVVGPRTRELASATYAFRELDAVRVKGRDSACPIYELLGPKGAPKLWAEDVGLYQQGLEAYRERRWQDAVSAFERFAGKHPDDGPARAMLRRIDELREHELGDDWDGVYQQTSK